MAVRIAFTDVDGCALSPGIILRVWQAGTPILASTLLASATTDVAGGCSLSIMPGQTYIAAFSGQPGRAPALPIEFAPNADGSMTTVPCPTFESPSKDLNGWAHLQRREWPHARFADAPANVDLLARWLGVALTSIDLQTRILLASIRLGSCTGTQVDAWARRYLGLYLIRFSGELDPFFVTRITALLSSPRCTLAAIALVAEAWLASVGSLAAPTASAQDIQGAQDIAGQQDFEPTATGGSGGLDFAQDVLGAQDIQGGQDVGTLPDVVPTILTFDLQSDPTRSAQVGLVANQLCVELVYANRNNPARVIGAPSGGLDDMVQLVKAGGYQPVYADNRGA